MILFSRLRAVSSLVFALIVSLSCLFLPVSAAGESSGDPIKTVPISVTWHSSEARKTLSEINAYRSDRNAWYWDSQSQTKIPVGRLHPSALSYDYALEDIAKIRLPELLFLSQLTDSSKRPNGQDSSTITSHGKSIEYEAVVTDQTKAPGAVHTLIGSDDNQSSQPYRQLVLSPQIRSVGAACLTIEGQTFWLFEFSTKAPAVTSPTPPVNGPAKISVPVAKSQYPALFDVYDVKQQGKKIILTKNGQPDLSYTGFLPAGEGKTQQILYFQNGVFQNTTSGSVTGDYNGKPATYRIKNGVVIS